jgi:hypothetical protein
LAQLATKGGIIYSDRLPDMTPSFFELQQNDPIALKHRSDMIDLKIYIFVVGGFVK